MTEGLGEFLVFEGVAWKRLESGAGESPPYCPKCHTPLQLPLGFQHFVCPNCKFGSNLNKYDVERIRQRMKYLT